MKKTNTKNTQTKKTPTYVKVIAGILIGVLVFGSVATAITLIINYFNTLA